MKKMYFIFAATAMFASATVTGCKSQKQVASQPQPYQTQPKPGYSNEDFIEPPCTMYDTKEIFTGSSSAYGSAAQEAVIRRAALTNAQNIARQKMKHAYLSRYGKRLL